MSHVASPGTGSSANLSPLRPPSKDRSCETTNDAKGSSDQYHAADQQPDSIIRCEDTGESQLPVEQRDGQAQAAYG
jgi:hypothetical protein